MLDALRTAEAVAASLWPLEVTNGLLTAERRGRIQAGDAARFGRLLLALPIVVEPVARSRAFEATRSVARSHTLSAYDAAHLELAVRLGVPLATLDERLGEAEGVGRWGR